MQQIVINLGNLELKQSSGSLIIARQLTYFNYDEHTFYYTFRLFNGLVLIHITKEFIKNHPMFGYHTNIELNERDWYEFLMSVIIQSISSIQLIDLIEELKSQSFFEGIQHQKNELKKVLGLS